MKRHNNLTLRPLKFDEAIADILRVKPEPKAPKAKRKPKAKHPVLKSKG